MRIATGQGLNKLTEPVSVEGFLTGALVHEIRETKSTVAWTGPKLGPQVWNPILAFFVETWKETDSECQVRLYVNTRQKVWAAWAFPQKKKTGMTAEEIQNEEFAKQRLQFLDSDGWQYFGTVHHHCRSMAFQSNTDRENEKTQDGLHMTVGKLDEKAFDLHIRFYLRGIEFTPDYSEFWDIGDPWNTAPLGFCNTEAIARQQMGTPPPAGTEYPAEWKANLIDFVPIKQTHTIEVRAHTPVYHGAYNGQGGNGVHVHTEWVGVHPDIRRETALNRTIRIAGSRGLKARQIEQSFEFLANSGVLEAAKKAGIENGVTVWDIVREWENRERRAQAQAGQSLKLGLATEPGADIGEPVDPADPYGAHWPVMD